MAIPFRLVTCAAITCVFASALSPVAAATEFSGPSGWTKTDVTSPVATRTIQQWHIGGDPTTSVTYISDATASYADALAAMSKNFSDNGIKPAIDKDMPCHGATAHVVEFTAGPDGFKTIINRVVVPQATGIVTITYTRGEHNTFDSDVQKAVTAYCAATS
jgi:hypothetical protein